MTAPATTFRPIKGADLDFLYEVFSTTRPDVDLAPWDDKQKEQFLRMQFHAQHAHYQEYFPDARFELILLDGQPVGRVYVERNDDELRILDIAVLPAHRNQGVGSAILQDLLDEAARTARPVRIYVETYNPSRRLFQRLGFRVIEDDQVNLHLEWQPSE